MQKSNIQWTDATWNPTRGCDKISPGCKFCYAEVVANRFKGVKGNAYEQGFALRLVPEKLQDPLRWKRGQRIFVNSMSDLFHEGVPFEFIDKVFVVISICKQHMFQILTKRSARMWEYVHSRRGTSRFFEEAAKEMGIYEQFGNQGDLHWPLPNVILGVSAENQEFANKRVPEAIIPLLEMGWKTMISAEPLLGPIVFKEIPGFNRVNLPLHRLWVIVGGESGHGARPMQLDWARSILTQCTNAKVACFYKQGGNSNRCPHDSKGGHFECFPHDMQIQEFLK